MLQVREVYNRDELIFGRSIMILGMNNICYTKHSKTENVLRKAYKHVFDDLKVVLKVLSSNYKSPEEIKLDFL